MNPELIAWATLIFTERAGTYEILSAEMLKAGYSRADIDAVYAELVTRAIAPPRAGATAPTPVAPSVPPAQGSQPSAVTNAPAAAPIAPVAPVPEATIVSENVVPRNYHLGLIFTVVFLLLLVGGIVGTYFYAKGNPTSALSKYINDTFVSLYLSPPFPTPTTDQPEVAPAAPEAVAPTATTSTPVATTTVQSRPSTTTRTPVPAPVNTIDSHGTDLTKLPEGKTVKVFTSGPTVDTPIGYSTTVTYTRALKKVTIVEVTIFDGEDQPSEFTQTITLP